MKMPPIPTISPWGFVSSRSKPFLERNGDCVRGSRHASRREVKANVSAPASTHGGTPRATSGVAIPPPHRSWAACGCRGPLGGHLALPIEPVCSWYSLGGWNAGRLRRVRRPAASANPGEAAAFARSGHANTLRAARDVPLSRRLKGRVVTGPQCPDVRWKLSS